MTSMTHPTRTAGLALTVVPAELHGNVAELDLAGTVLRVNIDSAPEDQLWAIADAVRYLQTGRASHGKPVRHLRVVTS